MGWLSRALSAGLLGREKQTPTTHVEAFIDRFSDGGSTPHLHQFTEVDALRGLERIEELEGGFDFPLHLDKFSGAGHFA